MRRRRVDVDVSGAALQALPLCLKSSGALEACCRCRDVEEASRYEGLEMRRRRVDVDVSGVALQALPQKRYGALEL